VRKHPRRPTPKIPDAPTAPQLTQHAISQLREVQAELADRRLEALKLYVPMEKQDEFHRCMASERILIGGNRCLAGEQTIYDPVARHHRRIAEIDGPFHVWSLNPRGFVELKEAERPFIKAYDDLYEVSLSNGRTFRCTLNHRVVDGSGRWVSVRDAWQKRIPLYTTAFSSYVTSPEDATCPKSCSRFWSDFSLVLPRHQKRDAGNGLAQKATLGTEGFAWLGRGAGRLPLIELPTKPLSARLQKGCSPATSATIPGASTQAICTSGRKRTTCETSECGIARKAKGVRRRSSPRRKQGLSNSFCADTPPGVAKQEASAFSWQGGLGSQPAPSQTLGEGEVGLTSELPFDDQEEFDATHPAYFSVGCVGPSVVAVRFLRRDAVWDTHVPGNNNYIMASLAHAQSGKSLSTFIEDARAATGGDPYNKYPKEGGNLVVIGRNWMHVGLVIVPMLFRAGAFKIIRDPETGQWRAFRPGVDDPAKAKPAPPLIPPRLIKDMSWVLKNAGYLNKAELTNGWTINCFSSEGEPPQGFQADLVHIDEDINNERWVGEMQARLADRKGRFVWSAMPHSKNDALLGLCERAEKAEEQPNPIIKKFTLRFLDNDHIDQEEKKKNIERWSALGVDELRMRAEGEFTTESTLMYPTFNPAVHVLRREELPAGQVPQNWTRYVAIDPGHTVLACLFGAVPPDEKYLLIYDELYIRQANSLIFGDQFAQKADGQNFYNFIIDMHGGMLRDLGSGRLPHELYSEELKKRNIRAQMSGHGFIPGSDDIRARTALVRQMLHVRGDGSVGLKFLEGSCPNLMRELRRYRKKTSSVNGQVYVTDEPQTRGEVHACQCLEYLCAYEPDYHSPPKTHGPDPWWVKYLADKRRREQKSDDSCIILGPMGSRR